MALVLAVSPVILDLVQQGLIERAFHDGLYPALQYRAEAMVEEWPANTGESLFMSAPGLLAPIVEPIEPGADPQPQVLTFEQWEARLQRFVGSIDVHMPTSAVASANLFLRNIHQIGLQAGQSLNRVPRNTLFKGYLAGHTVLIDATLAADTTIHVAAINGFVDTILLGTTARPIPVSAAAPLAITIGGFANTVVGFTPDNANDPFGPGVLSLGAIVGAIVPARSAVLSADRADIIRSGGGESIDAITAADLFSLQDVINASNQLRTHNVAPHEDGYYHAHISPAVNSQIFTDPAFQRLNTALPDHSIYHEGFLGTIGGIMFFMNTESPTSINTGALTQTGTGGAAAARYARDIGGEVINGGGVRIGRTLVTGKGAMYERYLPESLYVSEAGVTGKIGEFDVVNAGVAVMTERIRLYLRAPLDRLGDKVAATWSCTTSFPLRTDITATTGPQRRKRCIVIESAIG